MEIAIVSIEVITDNSKIVLICFGQPTLGITQASLVLPFDALARTTFTCWLKLCRNIQVPIILVKLQDLDR